VIDFRNFEINLEVSPIDFVDFRHDSAKQTSLMALAAPSVRKSSNKFGFLLAYS